LASGKPIPYRVDEISRDSTAPISHSTVTTGENSLWEIHDNAEKDVLSEQRKKGLWKDWGDVDRVD